MTWTRLAWLAMAACGAAAVPETPSNRATAPRAKPQRFTTMVIEEYATCTAPHHVAITIDGVARGTVIVPCEVPPVPHNGVIVTSSEPRVTNGPVFEVEPGNHTLVVRDLETGLEARHAGAFPVHGSLEVPEPAEKALADVLVIIVHVDWMRADVGVRANMILI
jgi:hypothetical protein